MADAVVNGARGRDQRLGKNLPAKDALPAVLGRDAAVDILFDPLEVEQRQQLSQRLPCAFFPGRAVEKGRRILVHDPSMKGRAEPRKEVESPGFPRPSPR
jgi:hypothetical protein